MTEYRSASTAGMLCSHSVRDAPLSRYADRGSAVRVALIGFGFAGRVFHAPLITATPGLALAVVGSSQGETVRSIYPHAEVVADPLAAVAHPGVDLVVIATPNDSHAPLAEAALGAGKHVVVDKPFTVTLAEARALAARAAHARRLLSVFQNRRWDSDFLGIAREVAGDRIGSVVELRSEFARYRPEVRDRWRERAGPGAGMWYDLGPHLVDQALVLFGPPATVQADLQVQRSGGSADDWFLAVLGYGRRRVILATSMLAAEAESGARFIVRGERGSLVKLGGDPQEAQIRAGKKPGSPGWGRGAEPMHFYRGDAETPTHIETPPGNWLAYYEAIQGAIRESREPPVTPAQATTVMAVIEAGHQSAAERRVVGPRYTEAERSAWRPVAE